MSDSTEPNSGSVPIGRGVFLASLLGGITALWWGRDVWSRVSGAISPVESLVLDLKTSEGRYGAMRIAAEAAFDTMAADSARG